jgi:Tol biopolymer transport system component
MDENKEKNIEESEEIIDNDKIDIKQDDEVIADDIFESIDEDENAEEPTVSDEKPAVAKTIVVTDESTTELEAENSEDVEDKTAEEEIVLESEAEPEKVAKEDENIELNKELTVAEAIAESEKDVFAPNPDIDAAVDDIVRTESDEMIAEADAKIAALQEKKEKPSLKQKFKNGLTAYWQNRPARYGTITALVVLFFAVTLFPATRYAILNTAGVRVASSMVVVDSQTRLPLKNINVQLQDKSGQTDKNGEISFSELKLGESTLVVSKRGYADINQQIVLGWGSNPIGEQPLVATGVQFTFVLSDWKSGESVVEAEATSGENSARADDTGKIVLTIGEDSIEDVEVTITAANYRQETYSSEQLTSEAINVKLVPYKKHVFVSNRDGNYDLYTIDVDGKNEQLLLAATGKEREVPNITQHETKNLIALTSSRDGEQNKDGFVFDGLFVVDTISGERKRIARSEQLQVIGWAGDKLVFLQVVEGTSAGNDERSKIVSFNHITGERVDLAKANYFNDVELIGDTLYYAVSSFAVPESQAKLYTVDVDGKATEKLIDMQVWNIFRTGYETLLFSAVDQKWFTKIGDGPVEEAQQQPAPSSRNYIDSPDGKRTIWVEIRDGKGVLLSSATDEFSEAVVLSMPGLYDVLYWVNDSTVVFRVISSDETADYVMSLDGGEKQKITDVTATRNTFFN